MTSLHLESLMGLVLFALGYILMSYGTFALLALVYVPEGANSAIIVGFIIFGFVLCIAGFVMARSARRGRL